MSFDPKGVRTGVMRRRRFLKASAALGATLLMPGVARSAEIRDLQGSAKVNGKPASRATRVRPGDRIETGPKSKLVLVIGADAFLLREKSRLNLEKSLPGQPSVIAGLRLSAGAMVAVFGPGSRHIQTSTAVAEIRGTGVYIEASAKQTYFCTCYGEVDLRDKTGKAHKLVVSGYHAPNLIYAQPVKGQTIVVSRFKDHTDDELIMLDGLVGRTSPIAEHNRKLKERTQPTQPEAPRPQAEQPSQPAPEKQTPAEPKPQAQPPVQPKPQPSQAQPPQPAQAPPSPPQVQPAAPQQAAPAPAAPPRSTPPSEPVLRLPPARLD